MADEERYRLAALRTGRARDEAATRGALADAVDGANARELAVRAAMDRAAAVRAKLAEAASAAKLAETSALVAVRRDRYAARLRRELEGMDGEVARRRAAHRDGLAAVDGARCELAAARARRELVERHFARWREARRKLADRRAD